MRVPQGVEKVVALATLSPEWRAKVLADPAAAAAEAGIDLSESEREVLRSVSARMLAGMIDSFGKSVPRPAGLAKLAAGAAVVALLTTTSAGCWPVLGHTVDEPPNSQREEPAPPPSNPRNEEPPPPVTKGIRPDVPPPKREPKNAEPGPPPATGAGRQEETTT